MNMDMPYEKLFRSYDRPLVDEAAALARVRGSEYGEPFLEAHREKFGAG